ncbi:hypothetical protein COU94_01190 [Candidatus Shapirobacteria bacterium CG10_big_fil_rev_8_21_14_0_10_38_8]|nr:MAG: hypothetical protein COU94_01190 [Candidatus Shapirobacteria bacterium CG10_big_fil_rev_8_21_14_0_10_38_8]
MKRNEILVLLLILLIAAFFRFWHLEITQFITYDQARDFLIIKRMLLDHKLTLLGPTVLIPGVFLPPFYYYLLAPFLMIFRFQPLGADFFTAILGISAVFLFYLFAREIFGKLPAALGSLLFAVCPVVISFSRHAWNPNTSDFFSLAIIFCLYRFLIKEKWLWFYIACTFFGLSLSFHFSLLVMAPVIFFVFLFGRRKNKASLKNVIIGFFSFLIFVSPLLFFEVRHHFSITSNIVNFVIGNGNGSDSIFFRLEIFMKDLFKLPWLLFNGHLIKGVESINPSSIILMDKIPIFYQSWSFLLILFIFIGLIIRIKDNTEKKGFFLILFWFLFGIGLRFLLPSKTFYFYQYNFLFPAVFLLLVNLFYLLRKKNWGLFLSLLLFFPMFVFSILNFFKMPNSLRSDAFFLSAAKIIADDFFNSKPGSYVIAANNNDPQRWDHNGLEYRYFLEAYYRLPISNWDINDYQQAKTLYLIDEGDIKEPLKLGGMEMESFAPKTIQKIWQAESGQKIYKMTR